MAEQRGVGGWGSRPVWPNDQQIFCALFRCNADHALVLSAAAKRPCWCLPILQRSVLQMKSGLSTRPRLRRPSLEKTSDLFHQEAGSGRETAIRSLQAAGLEILGVRDVTPQAHNGVRPKKRKRN